MGCLSLTMGDHRVVYRMNLILPQNGMCLCLVKADCQGDTSSPCEMKDTIKRIGENEVGHKFKQSVLEGELQHGCAQLSRGSSLGLALNLMSFLYGRS